MNLSTIIILCIISIVTIIIHLIIKYNDNINKLVNKLIEKNNQYYINKQKEYDNEYRLYEEKHNNHIRLLKEKINLLKQKEINIDIEQKRLNDQLSTYKNTYLLEIAQLNTAHTSAKQELDSVKQQKETMVAAMKELQQNEERRISEKLTTIFVRAATEFEEQFQLTEKEYNEKIQKLQVTLDEYNKKQNAINEAILRERKRIEHSEFYKINLSENEVQDLLAIKELSPRFNNKELLNKVIYESYIKRPLQEMIKRTLCGRSPSGIYKITRLKTGEIYIGRAVSVDKRWIEHVKSAFSIGTIAHSTLHTIMEKDGIWNFTFELLEEVDKDQLNEREKYYIEFYDSKNFGLNQKVG